MKPANCVLCNQNHSQQHGEWVMFADYQALEAHVIGHPPGFEFFCHAHVPYAKSFSSMPAQQAIQLLKQNLSVYGLTTQPNKSSKWLSFISKLYQPK